MDEVSNKTLATLLVVAIVISMAGTFFATKGASLTNIITGAATNPSGTSKVNITEITSITTTQNIVDFGNGYRNASAVDINTECNITTNASKPNCWINLTSYNPDPFTIENDGNNYVNITINSSTPANFLNGTVLGGTRRFQFVPSDSNNGPFPSAEDGCKVTFTVTGWTDFTASPQLICTNMSPFLAEDSLNVDINVSIPAGILGYKSTIVTFYAVKSAQG